MSEYSKHTRRRSLAETPRGSVGLPSPPQNTPKPFLNVLAENQEKQNHSTMYSNHSRENCEERVAFERPVYPPLHFDTGVLQRSSPPPKSRRGTHSPDKSWGLTKASSSPYGSVGSPRSERETLSHSGWARSLDLSLHGDRKSPPKAPPGVRKSSPTSKLAQWPPARELLGVSIAEASPSVSLSTARASPSRKSSPKRRGARSSSPSRAKVSLTKVKESAAGSGRTPEVTVELPQTGSVLKHGMSRVDKPSLHDQTAYHTPMQRTEEVEVKQSDTAMMRSIADNAERVSALEFEVKLNHQLEDNLRDQVAKLTHELAKVHTELYTLQASKGSVDKFEVDSPREGSREEKHEREMYGSQTTVNVDISQPSASFTPLYQSFPHATFGRPPQSVFMYPTINIHGSSGSSSGASRTERNTTEHGDTLQELHRLQSSCHTQAAALHAARMASLARYEALRALEEENSDICNAIERVIEDSATSGGFGAAHRRMLDELRQQYSGVQEGLVNGPVNTFKDYPKGVATPTQTPYSKNITHAASSTNTGGEHSEPEDNLRAQTKNLNHNEDRDDGGSVEDSGSQSAGYTAQGDGGGAIFRREKQPNRHVPSSFSQRETLRGSTPQGSRQRSVLHSLLNPSEKREERKYTKPANPSNVIFFAQRGTGKV